MSASPASAIRVDLPTGVLSVEAHGENDYELSDLCGFAARNNVKRGFLFLSKVLGKHYPSPVPQMQRLHDYLAGQLSATFNGNALFIGMAETATGLGQGVFEAYLVSTGRTAMFAQTTRYEISGATSLPFEETHSHAIHQFLYLPDDSALRAQACAADTVVICDDEASTGRTFAELVRALRAVNRNLTKVVLVLITDFSGGQAAQRVAEIDGIRQVHVVSAMRGRYSFEWRDAPHLPDAAPAFGSVSCRRAFMSDCSGRLGLSGPIQLPTAVVRGCVQQLRSGLTLVVGTGEFMHAGFVLARKLTEAGANVCVQSTTRSPILVANDVRSTLQVADPYAEGIPNFLYNFERSQYAQVFVVHETPSTGPIQRTLATIGEDIGCVEVNLLQGTVREARAALHRPAA